MLTFMHETWHGAADIVVAIATGALDILVTLHAAIAAMPLPFALMAVTGGVALFHTIDQRATRRDRR
jgi:hypothetical protein